MYRLTYYIGTDVHIVDMPRQSVGFTAELIMREGGTITRVTKMTN